MSCPMCGRLGAAWGKARGLHGHGGRERTVLGPLDRDGVAHEHTVLARRYRCTRCGAVIVVVPRGVWSRLRYGAAAIVLALGRWAVDGVASARVREEVSPYRVVGYDAARGWRSLRRWARLRGPPRASLREAAASLVRLLSTHAAMPTGDLVTDAVSAVVEGHRP